MRLAGPRRPEPDAVERPGIVRRILDVHDERVGMHRFHAFGRATPQEGDGRHPGVGRLDRQRHRRLAGNLQIGDGADSPAAADRVESEHRQAAMRKRERFVGPLRWKVVPGPLPSGDQFVGCGAPHGDCHVGGELQVVGAVVPQQHLHPRSVGGPAAFPIAHLGGDRRLVRRDDDAGQFDGGRRRDEAAAKAQAHREQGHDTHR